MRKTRNFSKSQSSNREGKLGIFQGPRACIGREGSEFFWIPKPIRRRWAQNFSKSRSLYSRGYSFMFSIYFFVFLHIFHVFRHIPSYLPHISPYFPHILSYSFIFSSHSFIFPTYFFIILTCFMTFPPCEPRLPLETQNFSMSTDFRSPPPVIFSKSHLLHPPRVILEISWNFS